MARTADGVPGRVRSQPGLRRRRLPGTPRLAARVIGMGEQKRTSDDRKLPASCPSRGPPRGWRVNVCYWGVQCRSLLVRRQQPRCMYREGLTGREGSLCVTACPHNRETWKLRVLATPRRQPARAEFDSTTSCDTQHVLLFARAVRAHVPSGTPAHVVAMSSDVATTARLWQPGAGTQTQCGHGQSINHDVVAVYRFPQRARMWVTPLGSGE